MSAITSGQRARGRARVASLGDPTVIAAAALTVITLIVRLSQIRQGLLGDEGFTYIDIVGKSFGTVLNNLHTGGENSPPLFFLFAWATAKLGNPTIWIRLPSIVLGAATVPVVYLIGRETVGRHAGLLAGAIVAASPFSFYYGVEARPYASMTFFVALSTWALLRAVRHGGVGWWALYVVGAVAGAYCHYTCIFVLLVQGAWSLWACRDRLAAPVFAAIVAIVLYIPWIPQLRGKQLGVIGGLEPLTTANVLRDLTRPIAGYPYAPVSAIPTWVGIGLLIACALGGLLARILRGPGTDASTRGAGRRDRFWLLVALALATPVGMLIYSEAATDLWLARGLYASMPAGALVLAALVLAIPRPVSLAAIVVVLGVLVFATVRAASPSWRRPPTRAVAAYLDREAGPRDPVADPNPFVALPVDAQLRHRHRLTTRSDLWRLTPPAGRAVLALPDPATGPRHPRPHPPAGFRLIARRRFFSRILPMGVWVYQRAG